MHSAFSISIWNNGQRWLLEWKIYQGRIIVLWGKCHSWFILTGYALDSGFQTGQHLHKHSLQGIEGKASSSWHQNQPCEKCLWECQWCGMWRQQAGNQKKVWKYCFRVSRNFSLVTRKRFGNHCFRVSWNFSLVTRKFFGNHCFRVSQNFFLVTRRFGNHCFRVSQNFSLDFLKY